MKHLFIINPAAGKKLDTEELGARISEKASARGEPYEIYITKGPMDACEKVRSAAESGEELRVYACGGDGTLNECVNGAAFSENVSVTHFPTGTGNDFIRVFGAADVERFRDLGLLMDGTAVPLDLIDCNGRCAINICSVGIDARIGTQVHEYSSKPLLSGSAAYVASLVVNVFRGINQHLKITHEGFEEGDYALVCVCNGSYYGGGFHPVPEARPDDGVLDCLIARKVSVAGFARMVGRYSKGRYAEMGEIMACHRGTDFKIECDEPLDINIDGELMRGNTVTFSLRPGAVRFVMPKGSDFLASRA
ncbi:MAG: diacylglycerol kinase family lipid kinase [Oscillospiraceae bacterium]|nr:diacylglycerol kinase family lipid kinase [Oscillospiraceae bacterium]